MICLAKAAWARANFFSNDDDAILIFSSTEEHNTLLVSALQPYGIILLILGLVCPVQSVWKGCIYISFFF